jgi:hypothetical protein
VLPNAPHVEQPSVPTAPPEADVPREPARTAAVSPESVPSPPAAARDEDLVQQVLQRYRLAYDGLSAPSARAVWPGVDEAALQRAFDGLQSQRLTFSECRVEVRGNSGSAVCRGSARYVTKIGSREPRIEPRVWNFRLRKVADDWQIESARAER